jgi:hypothetical protein
MSANDIYRIVERKNGDWVVYHDDADEDSDPNPHPQAVRQSLKAATEVCNERPAEYGYYIEWLDKKEES